MRFSSRLEGHGRLNALTRELARLRGAGREPLDLVTTNPTEVGLELPGEPVLSALSSPLALRYRPEPAGLPDARRAVARWYAERGVDVAPRDVFLTSSTSEAYGFLFKLLSDPGDEVLVPAPSYPLFEMLAAMECLAVRRYGLFYDGDWRIDVSGLESSLSSRSRAVVLVSPNNPTGSRPTRAELEAVLGAARDRGLAVISDEVFSEYVFEPEADRAWTLAGQREALSFSLGGLSKTAGLPQLKLAWIAAAGPEPLRRQAMERLEIVADTYLSLAAPVQHGLPALLDAGAARREVIASRIADCRRILRERGGAIPGCEVLRVEAGWSGILRVPRTLPEEEWVLRLLCEDGVLVHPGYFFDFASEAHLVLSMLVPPERLLEGLARLEARVVRSLESRQ